MPTVSTYSPTGDPYIDGVLSGTKWGVTSLTFSFPTDPSFYGSSYGWGDERLQSLYDDATECRPQYP